LLFTQIKTKATHLLRGENAEEQAHDYLLKKGLKSAHRNYRCKFGGLDLIMMDQPSLVIIEVKFRKTDKYGSALECVTRTKQSRIVAATHHYFSTYPIDKSNLV
jgi:putative endonuclease